MIINRPEAMNCLSFQDLENFGKVWMDFKNDEKLLVAILSGAGEQSFCAGADLKEMIPMVNSEAECLSNRFADSDKIYIICL